MCTCGGQKMLGTFISLRQGDSVKLQLTISARLTNQGVTPTSGFYVSTGDLNSGPHACTASTLIQ